MLNPTHLKTLREVLATGSFAVAAGRLGYTPSAVSQQVAALERESGVQLFERNGRSIRPTAAAIAVSDRAKGVLRSLDALEREFRAVGQSNLGVVSLGSFPTASVSLLPAALADLRRTRPALTVQLDEAEPEELVAALQAGGLDLALVHRYDCVARQWGAELAETPLLQERLFLLAPSATELPTRGRPLLPGLREATWIATREDTGGERCLLQLCARAGFSPRIDFRSNDYGVIRGLVKAGLGMAIAPALAVGDDPGITAVPLPDDAPKRAVLVLSRPDEGSGLVGPVVESLIQAAAGAAVLAGVRPQTEGQPRRIGHAGEERRHRPQPV